MYNSQTRPDDLAGQNQSAYESGDKHVYFTYDYMGRRVRKAVYTYNNGWPANPGEVQHFVYDGWNVVMVLNGNASNAITRRCTWGLDLSGTIHGAGGIGGLLAVHDMAAQGSPSYWFFYDANGNVTQVLDATDTENVVLTAHYEYDPYGNTIVIDDVDQSGYAFVNPFRFSTKWFDTETGLGYWGYRYYSPRLGQWISRDPIGERGGLNLYGFCENEPIAHHDVLGLFWGICCDKCDPKKDKPKVTAFTVAFGAAMHGLAPWTQSDARGAIEGAKLVGLLYAGGGIASSAAAAFAKGEAVVAEVLAGVFVEGANEYVRHVYVDETEGAASGFPALLEANDGIRIWVKVDYQKCVKCWCLAIFRRYDWDDADLRYPCDWANGVGRSYGFLPTDITGIARDLPGCIRAALRRVK